MIGLLVQESIEVVVVLSKLIFRCARGAYLLVYPQPCALEVKLDRLQERVDEMARN
jgi:hypothetical protein